MSVIIRPIITEKANRESELRNAYSFIVSTHSNKITIKKEIQRLYNVEVIDVRTAICAPKYLVKYTKKGIQVGKTNKYKKAIVKIKEGQVIDFSN